MYLSVEYIVIFGQCKIFICEIENWGSENPEEWESKSNILFVVDKEHATHTNLIYLATSERIKSNKNHRKLNKKQHTWTEWITGWDFNE